MKKFLGQLFDWSCMLAFVTLGSCYYDHEEILYPESANCIPVPNPSFNTDVVPILNARCNNCHSGKYPSAGIKLDTHSSVMISVSNGSLIGSIKHQDGFSAMPKNNSILSLCEIKKIEDWINAGSPQN